jgi:hypothetical protein
MICIQRVAAGLKSHGGGGIEDQYQVKGGCFAHRLRLDGGAIDPDYPQKAKIDPALGFDANQFAAGRGGRGGAERGIMNRSIYRGIFYPDAAYLNLFAAKDGDIVSRRLVKGQEIAGGGHKIRGVKSFSELLNSGDGARIDAALKLAILDEQNADIRHQAHKCGDRHHGKRNKKDRLTAICRA